MAAGFHERRATHAADRGFSRCFFPLLVILPGDVRCDAEYKQTAALHSSSVAGSKVRDSFHRKIDPDTGGPQLGQARQTYNFD